MISNSVLYLIQTWSRGSSSFGRQTRVIASKFCTWLKFLLTRRRRRIKKNILQLILII